MPVVLSLSFSSRLPLELEFIIDGPSLLFAAVVRLISGAVLVFSCFYMEAELFFFRFHALVLLFVTSMLTLIFRVNLVGVLIGWDGLGLSSYLLVIFYQGVKPLNAGTITAATNRLGDGFLLLAIAVYSLAGG